MPSELSVRARHQGGMRFVVGSDNRTVTVDYPLRPGDELGCLRPLELLLSSLAGCAGGTMALLLRRLEQPVQNLEIAARGLRRDEHPTVFTEISLEFVITGPDVDPVVAEKALRQAEMTAPVWAMLKAGTPISTSIRIVE